MFADSVLAEGRDCTSKHPLQHPIMVAIEAAAARDRRLWPSQSAGATGAPSLSDTTARHATAAQADSGDGAVHESDARLQLEMQAILQGDVIFQEMRFFVQCSPELQLDGVAAYVVLLMFL